MGKTATSRKFSTNDQLQTINIGKIENKIIFLIFNTVNICLPISLNLVNQ